MEDFIALSGDIFDGIASAKAESSEVAVSKEIEEHVPQAPWVVRDYSKYPNDMLRSGCHFHCDFLEDAIS